MRWLSRARVVRLSAGAVCPTVNTYLLTYEQHEHEHEHDNNMYMYM